MASIVDAEDDIPSLDFKSPQEEEAYFQKIEREREKEKNVRRATMMGGAGIMGAIEHVALFKLNPEAPDAAAAMAKRAGGVLQTIQTGIYGASFRPASSTGCCFDWVLKVQLKSTDDVELYYSLIEDIFIASNADSLVEDSLLIDLSGLRGSVKAGTGEVVVLFKDASAGEAVHDAVEEAAPKGLTKSSVRAVHQEDSLYAGYSGIDSLSHAVMFNFDSKISLDAFIASGVLQSALQTAVPEGEASVVSYVF